MERKWIHFLFALMGIGLFYLFLRVGHFAWESFRISGSQGLILYPIAFLLALVLTVLAWRYEKLFSFISECVDELHKVAWPTWKETMSATLVVICTVIVVSILLGVFDGVWSYLTHLLYNDPVSSKTAIS